MNNCYTENQICLSKKLRQLWEQHVYRTRFFIISTAAGLSDIKAVTDRLLQNPKDFAGLLKTFYGEKSAQEFDRLLTQHLLIGGDLVNAAKGNDKNKADEVRKKWYENADEIACFLSRINPHWDKSRWKSMLYSHLEMTEKKRFCGYRAIIAPI